MNKLLLAAGVATALAIPSLSSAAAKSAKSQPPAKSQAAMPADTKTFVKKAGMTNLFEIKAGEIAQQKSQDSKVQDYAKMIDSDHQKAQDELKAAVKDMAGVQVPKSLDQKHSKMIDELQSASGAKFLKTFKTQQVKGHKEAVKLFKEFGQGAQDSELKQFAQKTEPALEEHLKHAQALPTEAAVAPTVGAGQSSK